MTDKEKSRRETIANGYFKVRRTSTLVVLAYAGCLICKNVKNPILKGFSILVLAAAADETYDPQGDAAKRVYRAVKSLTSEDNSDNKKDEVQMGFH